MRADPEAEARRAHLRYVSDKDPGIARRSGKSGFSYIDADGQAIADVPTLERIRSIVIPPAWTDVWISPDPAGHLQATGRDKRGRKQYRYHPRWRAVRDATKFDRLHALASALPRLRRRVDKHLRARELTREKVLAAVVTLLETTCIRIGNEEYRRDNGAYGLTTLRKRHVELGTTRIRFEFRGKGGKEQRVTVRNRRLARVMARCEELPGRRLFQYVDEVGERRSIGSTDVNEYLREITGAAFTAKDFRTWWGSVLALDALRELGPADSRTEAEKNIVSVLDSVSERLANTRAVCRQFYVHPAILDRYTDGRLFELLGSVAPRDRKWMDAEEVALARFLDAIGGPGSETGVAPTRDDPDRRPARIQSAVRC